MESLKLRLNVQSISDIITNSSSEIFCRVESEEHIHEIETFLNKIGLTVEACSYDESDKETIDFWIEYGDNERITDAFVAMLSKLLSDYFPKGSYEILTNVD